MIAAVRARARRVSDGDDSGVALIFVLLVITVITIAVTSQLVVTASDIKPAKNSQDADQATAAAEAGIQDYIAYLSANCTNVGVACASVSAAPVTRTNSGAAGGGTSTFTRTVINAGSYTSDGFVRLRSTGTSGSTSRTLVADIAGLPSLQQLSYYTTYETLSGSYLDQYYPARTITIPSSTVAAATSYPSATKVSWAGRASANPTATEVCDRLYYDVGSTAGRATLKSAAVPVGYDYGETGTVNTATAVSRYGTCEENFTTGMKLTGPVYSRDALYISNGTNPNTNPTGPEFDVPATDPLGVQTGWTTSSNPAAPNNLYRQFPYVLGHISPASTTGTVRSSSYDLELPTSVSGAQATNPTTKCVYSGPTRILLRGATATVTSPYTPAVPGSACYSSAAGAVGTNGLGAAGVLNATVNVNTTLIYVQDLGSQAAWRTASNSVPVFASSTPATSSAALDPNSTTAPDGCTSTVKYSATGGAPCAWTNLSSAVDGNGGGGAGWLSYSPGTSCTGLSPTDRLQFECDFNGGSVGTPHDYYSLLRSRFQTDLSRNTCTGTAAVVATCVAAFMTTELAPANNATHRYVVTATATGTAGTGTTRSLGSGAAGPEAGDPFFASSTGSAPSETQTTTPITLSIGRQVYQCYGTTVLGQCLLGGTVIGNQWGNGTTAGAATPQFQTTVTLSSWTANAATNGTSTFPVSGDVTPYATGSLDNLNAPGDAYVEGTGVSGKLSVVAEHDVVVTGTLTTTATSSTDPVGEPGYSGGGAADLVAANDVRLYHPVSCKDTSTGTTAGFCPNDTTGLYSGGIPSAWFATAHPSRQYCDMTTGAAECGNTGTGSGAVGEIDADVFALGVPGADGSPVTAQTRQGSLLADNFDRGSAMGSTTVKGGVYQLHRGTVGVQWEITTTDTTAARPASGYTLQYTFLDLKSAGLPYVPAAQAGSNQRAWNVISMSTGTADS